MELGQSWLVAADQYHCRQLSEENDQITKDVTRLEERIPKLRKILQGIHDTLSTYKDLRREFDILVNEDIHTGNEKSATIVGNDPSGIQLSWDYEGLSRKQSRSYSELENEAERLEEFITKLENELSIKKSKIEEIREKLQNTQNNDIEPCGTYLGNMGVLKNGIEDQTNVTSKDEPVLLNKTRDLENVVKIQSAKIDELMEKNREMENEVNKLTKQKEELLRVNHQWDEQYRLLKDDKERVISELRNKPEGRVVFESSLQSRGGSSGQEEIIEKLVMEKETLTREVTRLSEKDAKTDSLWLSAKKMISGEREAREVAAEKTKVLQARCTELEHELVNEKETQICLKQEIERLVSGGESGSSVSISSLSPNVKEQIEVLKQQIRVYADDFANERSDRERIQTNREELKERLKDNESEIELLKQQIRVYQDDFNNERKEKERLQRQIRNGRPVNFFQNDDPWYAVPPNDYNPVQRHQPVVYERNEKSTRPGRTNFSPREIQEYAYQQQLQVRGNKPGHPGTLCHGCEADGYDVIDGVGQGSLQCPRCERKFSVKERRAFDEHIDKCTI